VVRGRRADRDSEGENKIAKSKLSEQPKLVCYGILTNGIVEETTDSIKSKALGPVVNRMSLTGRKVSDQVKNSWAKCLRQKMGVELSPAYYGFKPEKAPLSRGFSRELPSGVRAEISSECGVDGILNMLRGLKKNQKSPAA